MEYTKRLLQEAIETGEILTIIYHGGSQPGTSRQIAPMQINDEKVRARALPNKMSKVFMIDKIEITDSATTELTYSPTKEKIRQPEPLSLSTGIEPHLADLEKLGWHIEFNDEKAGLHLFNKNGKPKKFPSVSLSFQAVTRFEQYDEESDSYIWLEKPSINHWHTASKPLKKNISYKYLASAIETFLELAELSAEKLELQPNQ